MKNYYLIGDNCIVSIDSDNHNGFNNKNCKLYLNGSLNDSLNRREIWTVFISLLCANGSLVSVDDLLKQLNWYGDAEEGKERVGKLVSYIRKAIGDTEKNKKYLITYDADCPIQYQLNSKSLPTLFYNINPSFLSQIIAHSHIERTKELNKLSTNAFQGVNVHAIVGERGMGKTVLSQCFAKRAYRDNKYEHILFTRYKNDLKDTISQLPTYARLSESLDLFAEKIYLLKDLQHLGKTLLIIDNYDNSDYCDELCSDNLSYSELLSTGCDILFTSCTNLEGCFNGKDDSGLCVTNVSKFPTNKLIERFCEIKGDSIDSREDLRYLIDDLLIGNTYLVTMAARLAKKMKLKCVIDALDSLSTKRTRPIDDTKDGKKAKPASIYQHYCAFLNKHPIIEDQRYTKLLANLSLLPLEGLKYDDFFARAFEPQEQSETQALFADLVEHFLAFESDDMVYLHPIIREYVVDKLLSEEKLISSYLNCTIEHLTNETYSHDLIYWLNIGQAVEKSLMNKEDEFCLWSRACLNAYVASSYDIICVKESAYRFGAQAIKLMGKVNVNALSNNEKLVIAYCYNVSGYAVLHRYNKIQIQEWDLAHSAILKAMRILNELKQNEHDIVFINKIDISLTKVHGNVGACYLKINDYEKAKEWHERALTEREEMLIRNDCKENQLLICATYRCLGTDYFYLSRRDGTNKVDFLKESYENNKRSLQGYIDVYGTRHLDCTIGSNRLVGTGINLIFDLQNDELLKEFMGETFGELVERFYKLMNESIEFLSGVGIAINSEIKDCLQKIEQLTLLLESRNMLTEDKIRFSINAAERMNAIPGIDDEVHDIIERISATALEKVK